MKSMSIALLAFVLLLSRAVAGELYGTISENGKPVAAALKLEIRMGEKVHTAQTDKFGSYRIVVREKGKCTLTLHVKDQSPSIELFSYDKSSRYDWILETKEGKLSLRRK
jgi:hypothetical protein